MSNKKQKNRKLSLEERIARIEDWIDFWETVETPWDKNAEK